MFKYTSFQNIPRKITNRHSAALNALVVACGLLMTSAAGAASSVTELDTGPDGKPIIRFAVPDELRPAPIISFVDLSGQTHSLADYRGSLIALVFWATWCVPCREEMPSLESLAKTLAGEKFVILPVSLDRDGPDAVRRFYEDYKIEKLPIFVAKIGDVLSAFKLGGIPTTIFIDAEGRAIARVLGDRDWSDPEVVEVVRKLIAGG